MPGLIYSPPTDYFIGDPEQDTNSHLMMRSKQYQAGFGKLLSWWCLLLVTGAAASLVVDNVLAVGTSSAVGAARARATIEGVRVDQSPERTQIVFDLDSPVQCNIPGQCDTFTLLNPRRFVIDVQNAASKVAANIVAADLPALEGTPINRLRNATRNGKDIRVVFELNERVKAKISTLPPTSPYGDRLIIDLYRIDQRPRPVIQQSDRGAAQLRDIVIVIDAGHGGDDPGAVGKGNLYEKHLVLAIARKTAEYFKKQAGYQAVLTRKGDYYLSHKKRTDIARKHTADVFISIHADAFKTASVSGASVYAISKGGATSEAAQWLAEKENRSDLIGGGEQLSLADKPDYLADVLLDLYMDKSLEASLKIGDNMLKAIKSFNKLHRQGVEQAAFLVLKSPDIPSLLVETGYISNPAEAAKLNSKRHQAKIARAIVISVHQYMLKNPPKGSLLAWKKRGGHDEVLGYQIEAGDTLSEIAEKYQVSTKKIMRLNGLHNANIKTGQVLKIPLG